jgi:AcrR family transcriptional regulator
VNRPKDPALRQQLLERAVNYVLQHGVGGLSLRPMAKDMGTTARMLIHHFGSKEALISDVLIAIEESFAKRTATSGDTGRSVIAAIRQMWTDTAAPEMDLALRAIFEVWGHALVHPTRYESFLESLTKPWIEMLGRRFEQAGHNRADATTLATLAVGAFQGLQLIRLTSGDDARSTAALETLMNWLEHAHHRT